MHISCFQLSSLNGRSVDFLSMSNVKLAINLSTFDV